MAFNYRAYALNKLASLGPKYLPFADVATEDVPLSRLLRLSLFQVTVGMALVLLVGGGFLFYPSLPPTLARQPHIL